MSGLLHHPLRLAGSSLLRLQADDRLVSLAREGHDPAFAAIVERYRDPLMRYATRLVGSDRGEDAVQQAFVNAHRAMTSFEEPVTLRPWLYRITHNAALNVLRASRDEAELDDQQPASGSVEDVVELRRRLHDTFAAIHELPARQRDALLLRELEGRSHDEIASALGVTSGAARQHLMRARATVRAAVTAVTPYPLLTKVATAMVATAESRGSEIVAGAGLTAGATKLAAGVLAAGALVGGAATGDVPFVHPGHHRPAPAARHPSSQAGLPAGASLIPLTAEGRRLREAAGPGATDVSATGDRGSGAGARGRSEDGADGGRGSDDHAKSPYGDDGENGSGSGTSGDDGAGRSGGDDGSGSSGFGDRSSGGEDQRTPTRTDTSGPGSDSGSDGTDGTSGSGSSGFGSDDRSGSGASGPGLSGSDPSGSGSSGSGTSGSPDLDPSGSGSSGSGTSGSSGSGTSGSGISGSGSGITTSRSSASGSFGSDRSGSSSGDTADLG